MLRRAFKRSGIESHSQIDDKHAKRKREDSSLGLDNRETSGNVTRDRELEGIVFGGVGDMLSEIDNGLLKNERKTKKNKHVFSMDEKKPAWDDAFEETETRKLPPVPNWAKMEPDHLDRDVEKLLHRAGDLLVESTCLPAGILQIKKLADANADDTRGSKIQNVEFHPTAKVILTAGSSHRVNLFQIDGKHNPKIQSVFFDDFPIHTAHFSRNGEEIIVGSDRKNFMFYDMIGGKVGNVPRMKRLEGNNLARFEVSPDGKYLVFLGKYGSMHVLSAKTKEWITSLKMNGDVYCVSFTRDSTRMFSFGDTGSVFVWDMNTMSCVHTFIDEGCVKGASIAVSPNNQYVACGSQSGIVNIYDADTCQKSSSPKPLKAIMNLTTVCNKAKFNCTSEILAIASNENMKALKLVHFPSLQVFSNFPEQTDRQLQVPKCLDFSPNGGYMAVGNQKGQALLYRLKHYSEY
ncbi:U3 small nucleolar RNA-associated protein 18 homolog [Haliotis rubra]|uniref:U3 small nucleolar RNA-associated protein 18 homolog n=1 Tax=Haliotis rubra TaxID=36100 RepID=UPI001EE5F208|nr:U3 small nucleolar RNA-associated protein 18 homolog [Haliotis rubra]